MQSSSLSHITLVIKIHIAGFTLLTLYLEQYLHPDYWCKCTPYTRGSYDRWLKNIHSCIKLTFQYKRYYKIYLHCRFIYSRFCMCNHFVKIIFHALLFKPKVQHVSCILVANCSSTHFCLNRKSCMCPVSLQVSLTGRTSPGSHCPRAHLADALSDGKSERNLFLFTECRSGLPFLLRNGN